MGLETDYDLMAEISAAENKHFNETVVKPYEKAKEMAKKYDVYDAFCSLAPFYRVPEEILKCKDETEVRELLNKCIERDACCE